MNDTDDRPVPVPYVCRNPNPRLDFGAVTSTAETIKELKKDGLKVQDILDEIERGIQYRDDGRSDEEHAQEMRSQGVMTLLREDLLESGLFVVISVDFEHHATHVYVSDLIQL